MISYCTIFPFCQNSNVNQKFWQLTSLTSAFWITVIVQVVQLYQNKFPSTWSWQIQRQKCMQNLTLLHAATLFDLNGCQLTKDRLCVRIRATRCPVATSIGLELFAESRNKFVNNLGCKKIIITVVIADRTTKKISTAVRNGDVPRMTPSSSIRRESKNFKSCTYKWLCRLCDHNDKTRKTTSTTKTTGISIHQHRHRHQLHCIEFIGRRRRRKRRRNEGRDGRKSARKKREHPI